VFLKDFEVLDADDKARFKRTVLEEFIPDLAARQFRPGLRVKGVRGASSVFEMTWAPDGAGDLRVRPGAGAGPAARHLAARRHARHLPGTVRPTIV